MKVKTHGMLLGLFFSLVLVFSFSIQASAHNESQGNKMAEDVNIASEAEVGEFLSHIIEHFNPLLRVNNPNPTLEEQKELVSLWVIFFEELRKQGVFNDGDDMYSIIINSANIIDNHPGHPGLYGKVVDPDAQGSQIGDALRKLIKDEGCAAYRYGGEDRQACGEKVDTIYGEFVVIAGLHHDEEDSAVIEPDCTGLELDTTAGDVENEESLDTQKLLLKLYVKSIISVTQDLLVDGRRKAMEELRKEDPDRIIGFDDMASIRYTEFQKKIACFSEGDFKEGSIYVFIMELDEDATVVLNGNSPQLNGLNLRLRDPNPNPIDGEENKNIAELLRNSVTENGTPKDGKGDFVEYHWLRPGDEPTPQWLENNLVPGNSHKISYIEAADVGHHEDPVGRFMYIFGSGVYPESDEGNGACTVAGKGNTPQGALLNLFLTASVLFSVVFPGRRARKEFFRKLRNWRND
ncbi:MAG: hypothetical protein OXI02_03300 [Candidatus Dadabacteria bacterium]|nr:hypothetical protein [Candidatus Dadabacteria bacterium]MDE0477074.1 hypothetical protein [Candidatus Dadabacteria bacterium]